MRIEKHPGMSDWLGHLKNNHDKMRSAFVEHKGEPFLLGRFGCAENWIIEKYFKKQAYADHNRFVAAKHVGLSPPTDDVLNLFSQRYIDALRSSDLISLPHYGDAQGKETLMKNLQSEFCPNAVEIEYNIMENPFCLWEYSGHWIHILDGMRVLVVSPLTKSIQAQLPKLSEVYSKIPRMTPAWSSVVLVKSPLTQTLYNGTEVVEENLWIKELHRMESEIDALKDQFDIALLGCGGYAMPLCGHIKSLGKQAIMYGGALQLLFGIMGQRWEQMPQYKGVMTPAWIRPAEEERPKIWKEIEGGCYW